MSRCQILTRLPKAKPGSLSVVFADVKPASIINVWPGPTASSNGRIDKHHPGINLRQKGLPSFRKGVIAWYAYPFAILTRPEKPLTWERTYEPWRARLARGARDGVLPPPLTHGAHPERLDLALNFILTKGNFHPKRTMRKNMMRKINNAIALIVQRGADTSVLIRVKMRTLFYPGWAYVCAPQMPAYSLSIPAMVKSIRDSFRYLSSEIIALEREWAHQEKRKLVLPSTQEIIAAKEYSSTLLRPNTTNQTFQWYWKNMKEASKRYLERRYVSPRPMPALDPKAAYEVTDALKAYPKRRQPAQTESTLSSAGMLSTATPDTGDLLFGSSTGTNSNALLDSLFSSLDTQNSSGQDEVDFSWLNSTDDFSAAEDESDIATTITFNHKPPKKKDSVHKPPHTDYKREKTRASSVNTVPDRKWDSRKREERKAGFTDAKSTTFPNTVADRKPRTTKIASVDPELTSKGDEIDMNWLSRRSTDKSKPKQPSVSSLERSQNRLKRGTGNFVKPTKPEGR
ncbi:hypothetical protein BDZ89DRAFT_1056387 [Hymenopellis radicata]|nr:hypothetical protein BDZ89DRAFT_1056387 [Hymenopellis radicata]